MVTINVTNLIFKLQEKLNSTTNEQDLLYYTKAISQLKSAQVFTVPFVRSLPSATTVQNLLYYVLEDETLYFSSSEGWIPLYDTVANSLYLWGGGSNAKNAIGLCNLSTCSPVQETSRSLNWGSVELGSFHGVGLKTDGTLWTWGSPSCGRLGDGALTGRCSPVLEASSSTNWCVISASTYNTAAVKTDGSIWVWGNNTDGIVGDGTTVDKCSPVREISSSTNWRDVSVGDRHTSAVRVNGQVWTWGRNNYGQLGDGTTVNKCSPVREVTVGTSWICISTKGPQTAAINTSGQVWTWGRNNYGQLGDGTTVNKCSPVRERSSSTDWCNIAVGITLMSAIKTSGQLWVWGSGFCGNLGDGTTVAKCSPVREISSSTNWCDLSSGRFHSAAIKTDGSLWSWGCNNPSVNLGDCGGQLGDGTTINRCSPVREITSATDWFRVAAGNAFSAAIKTKVL